MELTQLRYFYQTYQSGSIRKSASLLNITQQALSKQIRNLESELDVRLFYRSKSGVTPTEYAHMLAEKVERTLPELDDFVYSLQHRREIVSGVVRLGVQCWQMAEGAGLDYGVLREFMRGYPQIRLVWENASPGECVQGVVDGRLDLCVAVMPNQVEKLKLTPLRSFQSYVLMAKSHPLAEKRVLSCEDLSGQVLIVAREEEEIKNWLRHALLEKEPPVFLDLEDSTFDLLGQKILGDHGLMLALEAQNGLFNSARFAMVPIQLGAVPNQLYLIRHKYRPSSPAAGALYRYLGERWGGGDNL